MSTLNLSLRDGESFIHGRSPEKAKDLLERAAAAGHHGRVRTTTNGYIVPSAILDGSGDAPVATPVTGTPETATSEEPTLFDPTEHTIAEVEEYLSTADEKERERVLTAEREGKKARKTLLAETEGDK